MNRPLTGIRADRAQSYYSIEQSAAALRKRLGLGALDRFNAIEFFDRGIGELKIPCSAGLVSVRDGVDSFSQEGRTLWDADAGEIEIGLSERTYALLREDHVRARSTVAHETGHAMLHADQIIRLAGMSLDSHVAFHRDRTPHQAYQDTEWQANAFGSALLMPAAGIERLFLRHGRHSLQIISETFYVSPESAHYRVETYQRGLGSK